MAQPVTLQEQAQAVTARLPRKLRESNAVWARRIFKNEPLVQSLDYATRIDLLATITGATQGQLRLEQVLRDTPAQQAAQAQAITARLPRKLRESNAAWARRIFENDPLVQSLAYDTRIALLATITGATQSHLCQEPALRDTPAQQAEQAQAVTTRLPRQPREANLAWARRIFENESLVQSLAYDTRIALLATITGATQSHLCQEPALRDTPAQQAEQAQAVTARLPRQPRESKAAWARRIFKNEPLVQSLDYAPRIDLLATITGARQSDLRKDPALCDTPAQQAEQAQAITVRLPRQPRESKAAWARRIFENDPLVQSLAYDTRIALLATITGATQGNLRQEPTLRDTPAQHAKQAQAVTARLPRQPRESNMAWARRIFENDPLVQSLDYAPRIDLLATITGLSQGNLCKEPALRDTPAQQAKQAQAVTKRLPRQPGESNTAWARRIFENEPLVQSLAYDPRIDLLTTITGARQSQLCKELALRDTPAQQADEGSYHDPGAPPYIPGTPAQTPGPF